MIESLELGPLHAFLAIEYIVIHIYTYIHYRFPHVLSCPSVHSFILLFLPSVSPLYAHHTYGPLPLDPKPIPSYCTLLLLIKDMGLPMREPIPSPARLFS
jgi:hypothetical protein